MASRVIGRLPVVYYPQTGRLEVENAGEFVKKQIYQRLDELAHNALAKGLINQEEAAILTRAEHSRLRSINVDDFAPEELATKPVKLPEKVRKVEAA